MTDKEQDWLLLTGGRRLLRHASLPEMAEQLEGRADYMAQESSSTAAREVKKPPPCCGRHSKPWLTTAGCRRKVWSKA